MIETLCAWALTVADLLLLWAWRLSPDLALILIAVASAAALALLRRWTTPQAWLHRARADLAVLKTALRTARQNRDAAARARHLALKRRIDLQRLLRAELPALAAALPVLLILAQWAYLRLEFRPVQTGETVTLHLEASPSWAGQTVHMVPGPEMAVAGSPIRSITAEASAEGPVTVTWSLTPTQTQDLHLRLADRTLVHPVVLAPRPDPVARIDQGDGLATRLDLIPYRAFGFIPTLDPLWCPAWLLAYLMITLPGMFVLRRLARLA